MIISTSKAHSNIHKTGAFQSIVDKKAANGAGVVQVKNKKKLLQQNSVRMEEKW